MSDWYEDEQVRFPILEGLRSKRHPGDETLSLYEIKTRGYAASAVLLINRSPDATFVSARLYGHSAIRVEDPEKFSSHRVPGRLADGLPQWRESAWETLLKWNGTTRYQSYLTSQSDRLFIELTIGGEGAYQRCVETWREFVEQLVIKDVPQGASSNAVRRKSRTGRLPAPPSTPLPPSLEYLRTAIEALARQPIADLETSDSDIAEPLRVLNERFGQIEGVERHQQLTASVEQLRVWSESLHHKERKWLYAAGHLAGLIIAVQDIDSGPFE